MNKHPSTVDIEIKDGILMIQYAKDCKIEKHHAEKIVKLTRKLTNLMPYHCVVDIRNVKKYEQKAMDVFLMEGKIGTSTVCAFIIDSLAIKIFVNILFYFKFYPPKIKVFTVQAQAIQWVKKEIENESRREKDTGQSGPRLEPLESIQRSGQTKGLQKRIY